MKGWTLTIRALAARLACGTALTGAAVLAAGCGAGSPGASPGLPSAAAQQATSTQGTAHQHTVASGHRQAAPELRLHFPGRLAAGTFNPARLSIGNAGSARTVTVHLQADGLTAATAHAAVPDEQVVVQRRNPASGSWSALRVKYITLASGGFAEVAAYRLRLPAHATVTESLRVIPGGVNTATIHVSVSGSSFATVADAVTLPLVTPALTENGPSAVARGSTPEFDFTLANRTPADYPAVNLSVMAYGSSPNCATAAFPAVQWSDGGAWHSAAPSDLSSPVATVPVKRGQELHIRLKLDVPDSVPACLARGQVSVAVWLPGGGSAVMNGSGQQQRPGFFVRRDSPFFTIR